MSQLEAYLDMDSTDEKMHKKMRKVREKDAQEIAKKQQKEIAKKQKEEAKTKKDLGITNDTTPSGSSSISDIHDTSSKLQKETTPKFESKAPTGKGMQLGKPKKIGGGPSKIPSKFDFGTKNDPFVDEPSEPEPKPDLDQQPTVELKIHEFANCEVTKFGDVSEVSIKGTVSFTVSEESKKVSKIDFIQPQSSLFRNFKVNGEIDKKMWKERGELVSTDQEHGFTPGSEIQGIIYKHKSSDETQLPFELSIFTTKAAGGKIKVALEVEFLENSEGQNSSFKNVEVKIAIQDEPKLIGIENSTTNLESGSITWIIADLNSEYNSASLQFHTKSEEESMFPLKVGYEQFNTGENTDQLFIRQLLI